MSTKPRCSANWRTFAPSCALKENAREVYYDQHGPLGIKKGLSHSAGSVLGISGLLFRGKSVLDRQLFSVVFPTKF